VHRGSEFLVRYGCSFISLSILCIFKYDIGLSFACLVGWLVGWLVVHVLPARMREIVERLFVIRQREDLCRHYSC
jgi:uncharacterized membrane protein